MINDKIRNEGINRKLILSLSPHSNFKKELFRPNFFSNFVYNEFKKEKKKEKEKERKGRAKIQRSEETSYLKIPIRILKARSLIDSGRGKGFSDESTGPLRSRVEERDQQNVNNTANASKTVRESVCSAEELFFNCVTRRRKETTRKVPFSLRTSCGTIGGFCARNTPVDINRGKSSGKLIALLVQPYSRLKAARSAKRMPAASLIHWRNPFVGRKDPSLTSDSPINSTKILSMKIEPLFLIAFPRW